MPANTNPSPAAEPRSARYSHRGQSIGMKSANAGQIIVALQKGLPYKAITTLEKESGLTVESIAQVVQVPPRTLARRRKAGRFEQLESERLLRLGMVFEKALELFEGDRAAAGRWLRSPIKGLGGQTPLTLTQTELGAREVEDLIGRLEHGVFS